MTVYVDGLFEWQPEGKRAAKHGNNWCHMVADDVPELLAFATRIGLRANYLQMGGGGRFPHFDLTPGKRKQAIKLGAIEVTSKELLQKLK